MNTADFEPLNGDGRPFQLIELEAGDWLGRRDRGLSEAEEEEFARWLERDPRHAAIFSEMDETWELLDRARELDPSALVVEPAARPRSLSRLYWIPAALAAAAAVAVAYVAWRPAGPEPDYTISASTEVGGLKKLALPDGSVIQLNTDSAVEVRYFPDVRRVRLVRGEATFAVSKNPSRPFIVSASEVTVRAVGTAFDVRLGPDSVEVLVAEGKVRVDDADKGASLIVPQAAQNDPETLLVAGQRVRIPVAGMAEPAAATEIAPGEVTRALAWQENRLEFVAEPLADIVAEFNRHNRSKLVIADPELAARRFGGTFQADSPETFVHLLETNFGVVAERQDGETILRPAR